MQGLGSRSQSLLAWSPELQGRYLRASQREKQSLPSPFRNPKRGPDVAAIQCSARLDGDSMCWTAKRPGYSNGEIGRLLLRSSLRTHPKNFDPMVSVAARGISAFVVDAGTPDRDQKPHRRNRTASAGHPLLLALPHSGDASPGAEG